MRERERGREISRVWLLRGVSTWSAAARMMGWSAAAVTRGREAVEEQDERGAPRAIFTPGQKDGMAEVSRTRSAEVGAVATSMDWASLLGHASDGCSQPLHALPQLLARGVIAGLAVSSNTTVLVAILLRLTRRLTTPGLLPATATPMALGSHANCRKRSPCARHCG